MTAVYLDNNATTRPAEEVIEAMLPFFVEHFGNASSPHRLGSAAARAIRRARQEVGALLGAKSEQELIFTSGATESSHTVLHTAARVGGGRDELVLSSVEHPSVLFAAKHLEASGGLKVRLVPVDGQGRLDLDAYKRALSPRTALASVMWANNETGNLYPVARLAELAHAAGALFHTDAVQALGRVEVDLGAAPAIDFLSASAHKLHGPKGMGVLFVRKGVKLAPALLGGKQEWGRRAGTENVPGIVGFGAAVERARVHREAEDARVTELRNRLERGVLAAIPRARVNGDASARLGNTTNLSFERIDAEALVGLLDRAEIAASSGSACASGMNEPSHVLRAMRVPPALAMGAVRFSLSKDNSDADIDRVLEVLPGLVESLRVPRAMPREAALAGSQWA